MSRPSDPGPLDPALGRLLEPLPHEQEAFTRPAWADAVAQATLPSAAEVQRLRTHRRRRRPLRVVVPLAALAAVLLLSFALWPRATPLLPAGTLVVLAPAQEAAITKDVMVSGTATLEITARAADSATVRLDTGRAVFAVDPEGTARKLRVQAGDVTVVVTGTRFLVGRDGGEIEVAVERGSVRVEGPELTLDLTAGQRWRGTGMLAALPNSPSVTSAPPPAPAPSAASPPATAPEAASPTEASPTEASPTEASTAEASPDPEPEHDRQAAVAWANLLDAREAEVPAAVLLPGVELFLDTHHASPLATEAAFLWVELAAEAWPPERALAAVDAWLVANAASPHLASGHLLRARLLLARPDDEAACRHAADSLAVATARGGNAVAAEARAMSEGCR